MPSGRGGMLIRIAFVLLALNARANADGRGATVLSLDEKAPTDVAAPPAAAKRLASGVATKVLRAGGGTVRPGGNDCVRVVYAGWKRDGSFLMSSSSQGPGPEDICMQMMVPGVAEAVKKMVVGEERRVWVPAALTVGNRGEETHPGVDATFDVKLVEVIKAPSVPSDLASPSPRAVKMDSGLVMKVLRPGTGTIHPGPRSHVTVHFSGWTRGGDLIESSVMAHRSAEFDMRGVIPGWREALLTMGQGQKVRLWIPAKLGYGEKPRRGQPKGDLVYDLELLAIDP